MFKGLRRVVFAARLKGQPPPSTPLERRVMYMTAIAVTSAIAVSGVVGLLSARAAIHHQLDETLTTMGSHLIPLLAPDLTELPEFSGVEAGLGYFTVQVINRDGSVVLSDGVVGPTPDAAEMRVAATGSGSVGRTASVGRLRYRAVTLPITQAPGHALIVSRPLHAGDAILRSLTITFVVLTSVGLVGSGALGWLVAWRSLAPLRELAEAFERVSATDELDPLPTEGRDDLSRLTISFNEMLGSLAMSRRRQSQLIADAGHELRTPLTSLRTNAELLRLDARQPVLKVDDQAQVVEEIAVQTVALSALISDLVQLARDDRSSFAPEPMDLRDAVEAAVARVGHDVPGLGFRVALESCPMPGEPGDLERAVRNVLQNAARHTPPEGSVEVTLADHTLTIRDHGPGIAPRDLPFVFDRFFRAESSRSSAGTGLGLSIAAQTIARNGGTISAANDPTGGAVFTIAFAVERFAAPERIWSGARH